MHLGGDLKEGSENHGASDACMCAQLCPTLCNPTRLLCPWDYPGRNTRMGCHFLLQRIFLIQGSNPHLLHLLHWQADSYQCATCEAHFMWVLLNNASQPLVKLIKLSLGKPCLSLSWEPAL